jgi:hypothetical protein
MHEPLAVPLACWSFSLVDEVPGPSVGDAAEHLEGLGFNPWSFQKLELIYEFTRGRMVTGVFLVVGSPKVLAELRAMHDEVLESRIIDGTGRHS